MGTMLDPMWKQLKSESPQDILFNVVMEGVHRLVLRPVDDYQTELIGAVTQKTGYTVADAVDTFISELANEVTEVAARLAYTLAHTSLSTPSYEAWLNEALARAGLTDYELAVRMEPIDTSDTSP